MRRLVPVVLAGVTALLLGASGTIGYLRSTVDASQNADPHCLYWPAGALQFHQSKSGAPNTPTAPAAITRSWQSWQTEFASCGNLTLSEGAPLDTRAVGFSQDGKTVNDNVVLFRPRLCNQVVPSGDACLAGKTCNNTYDCWPDEYDRGTIALTTNTYDVKTGRIYDSDIELNAASFYFTTADAPECPKNLPAQGCVVFDVQNTATHEFGHVLGLAHDADARSTMFASAPVGQISKRSLDEGSKQFVCDVYPKGAPSQDCIVDQSNGALGSAQGCSTTASGVSLAALIALAFAVRRRAA